jgi:xylulose-5-phosphate/fructose-6-phosphate phosphoketolase
MTVMNDLDRFHLARDVIARVPGLATQGVAMEIDAYCGSKLAEHHVYIRAHGDDMPDVRDWQWPAV